MTPLILLPPSEGKARGGRGAPWSPGKMVAPELDARRAEVMAALAGAVADDGDVVNGRRFGVKGEALAAALASNAATATARTMPAIKRYTGVLYDALDAASLEGDSRRRLNAQVRILSGLWGVVAPPDPIPDYKLKMGATLPGLGVLSTWWRPAVSAVLDAAAARRVVWNLLPLEHAAAWSRGTTAGVRPPALVITVRFVDEVERAGRVERVTVSHWNKLLKGALVRHLLEHPPARPLDLVGFEHPLGYRLDRPATVTAGSSLELTFVKPTAS